jgi:hypothetical protein
VSTRKSIFGGVIRAKLRESEKNDQQSSIEAAMTELHSRV